MNKDKIKFLFYKYFNDLATEEESRELARLLQQDDLEDDIKIVMKEAWETFHASEKAFDPDLSEKMLHDILGESPDEAGIRPVSERAVWWKAVAAAAIVALSISGLYYSYKDQPTAIEAAAPSAVNLDIAPGTNKAFLTLADGRDIVLDNASPGLLTTEGNTRIIKEEGDRLSYRVGTSGKIQTDATNTLRTPRGGQYHLVLPDGTRVWLNAASSIVYPVQFNGSARKVTIEGEVFFEVAQQYRGEKKVPFLVTVRDVSVEVLGTQFNINAYHDEAQIRTTLLEGSVKVRTPKSTSLLSPGHAASVGTASTGIRISRADTDQAIAWKNGFFQFQQASLEQIMRQLSKWYDLEVRYEGKALTKRFSGEIPRSATLLQVLEILELNQIQIQITGNEITIRT